MTRKAVAAILLAIMAAAWLGVGEAKAQSTSGSFRYYVTYYSTPRTLGYYSLVVWNGSVTKFYHGGQQPGSVTYGLPSGMSWALGLRTASGSQFSRLQFYTTNSSGTFPGPVVGTPFTFYVNTRGYGLNSSQYGEFSGSISW